QIAVGLCQRQRALLLGFEQAHVLNRNHRLGGEGLDKRDLFVGKRSDLPSSDQNYSDGVTLAQQWRPERGTMPLAFCIAAANRVLGFLGGEIMDMNCSTIACGSPGHRLSVCANSLVSSDNHRNFPV